MKNYLIFTLSLMLLLASCNSVKKETHVVVDVHRPVLPVLTHKEHNKVFTIKLSLDSISVAKSISSFEVDFKGTTSIGDIASASILYSQEDDLSKASVFGTAGKVGEKVIVEGNQELTKGDQYFWLTVKLNGTPDLNHKIKAQLQQIKFLDDSVVSNIDNKGGEQRLGIALKQKGEEGVHTYRIPGLATTNKGTLIAVYDIRYNSAVDLQADVDVGLSRSTDGGQTWEPMKVIMDMGEYGGLPQDENGIGDPAVLVDKNTGTIWVAALWLYGNKDKRAWWASDKGITPEETGQFMLVKSEDDGLTWSEPINITAQVKNPEWKLFFNGPGAGITTSDGTLVFAAQYKDKDAVPHSTIIYSKDGGKTWSVGTGAKSETTEAQVVELSDGSLMLNMRDDRNRANRKDSLNGRSVAITKDLGKTWVEHPTSRKALIEPNCMASIIGAEVPEKGRLLFFSNPNSKTTRNHIGIKTSFDDGLTWPEANQIELYEEGTYGYSCLTRVDKDHIGILYEGVGELYFQKIPIKELLK